jgi:NADH dehydrogenase [ubiquinone] 1 alpha subcomplex assembly factor 1
MIGDSATVADGPRRGDDACDVLLMLKDFSVSHEAANWVPINDAVMGGESQSRMVWNPAGYAEFTGTVSFANNGGFASVRCHPAALGIPGVIAYVLHVLGDGKRYKLNMRIDDGFDGVNYQCRFQPPVGIWSTCRLTSADFIPTWRGRSVTDAPPFDPGKLRQIGLMIADQQEGVFSLAIRNIMVDVVERIARSESQS